MICVSWMTATAAAPCCVRPCQKLRDEVAAGSVDRLYVLSPDRLARRHAHMMLLVEELEQAGVELVMLQGSQGSSPEDALLMQVQAVIAEYEREKIAERCRRGRLHAARCGRYSVIGKAAYGYRYQTKAHSGGEGQLTIYLEEAQVVRQIFAWVGEERLSLGEVVRRLARQSVPSPRGQGRWSHRTVSALLHNPLYKGHAAFGKTRMVERTPRLRGLRGRPQVPRRARVPRRMEPSQWVTLAAPPLVSAELFEAVAEQLQENRLRHRRHHQGPGHLLSGLLVCGNCAYAYTARGSKKHSYQYYCCSGRRSPLVRQECQNRPVPSKDLDQAVWEDVCQLLADPQRVQEEYHRRLSRQSEPSAALGHLQAVAGRLKRSLSNLIDGYADGLLCREEFQPRVLALRERLEQVQSQCEDQRRHETEQEQLRLAVGQLEAFAGKVKAELSGADPARRQQIVRTLIKRIEVHPEEVRIVYRLSLDPFDLAPRRGGCHNCYVRYPAMLAGTPSKSTERSVRAWCSPERCAL